MKSLKRNLGYVWMALGPAVMVFMLWQAVDKILLARQQVTLVAGDVAKEAARSVVSNTILQWSIIIAIFLPIACGMIIFGKYAVKGEYDNLPDSSEALV
ncbi:MAG: hypothetical protein LH478_14745 [Chitinophagaceae bacterium]|nr:hypothetical protein [Chitinophagaceae bacterium]